jgi:polysaccharide deacetylase family protein (PEP-CTERM system associated)
MNVLTFDIEDWFHLLDIESTRSSLDWQNYESRVEASTGALLEMLARHRQRATFFVLGWVAERCPALVRSIVDAGFEIGSHSARHQLVYEQSREEFEADFDRSVKTLEDISGRRIRAYRAPGFSLTRETPWVFDALIERGIEFDCSIFPAGRGHGGFPGFGPARPVLVTRGGAQIKEFPINTASVAGKPLVFSGGGYFRLLPYPLIRRLMRAAPYVMTYFHPRDFDAGQPVLEGLPPVRRFKSYVGIGGAKAKLDKLLREFPFADLAEADAGVDWSRADRIPV